MDDIVPELLEKIQNEFRNKYKNDSEIEELIRKLETGAAKHAEAYTYAGRVGSILTDAYADNLSSAVLPEGKMWYNIGNRILTPTMEENYQYISNYVSEVQRQLNEAAGIGIKPVVPPMNESRTKGIIDRLSSEDDFDKISWILREPIKTISRSIVDDSIKANAEFHGKSGMQPKIIRKSSGKCCKWCNEVAGIYRYPDVPKDVYRRHENCDCVVEYDPWNGKRQNVHTKQWRNEDVYDKIELRKTVGLEKKLLKEKFSSSNDPMIEVLGRAVDSHPEEVEQIIKTLEEWGVEINESNALGYGVAFRGDHGIMSITKDASYSAWLHEFQHIKDAKENGWDAAEVLYGDMEERISRERKAYQIEIDLANSIGYTDIAKRLEGLLNAEIRKIREFFGC